MSIKELKELLKVLRANGVVSYEAPELKLSLLESIPNKEPLTKAIEDFQEPTQEELLYYSSQNKTDD